MKNNPAILKPEPADALVLGLTPFLTENYL
jgi:hypothetical protein